MFHDGDYEYDKAVEEGLIDGIYPDWYTDMIDFMERIDDDGQ